MFFNLINTIYNLIHKLHTHIHKKCLKIKLQNFIIISLIDGEIWFDDQTNNMALFRQAGKFIHFKFFVVFFVCIKKERKRSDVY